MGRMCAVCVLVYRCALGCVCVAEAQAAGGNLSNFDSACPSSISGRHGNHVHTLEVNDAGLTGPPGETKHG